MKSCLLVLALVLLPAAAQEQKQRFTINVGTPEGQMLQSIGQESDDAKKLALAEAFLEKYPKHEGAGWVTGQAQAIYIKQKEYDKAIAAGEKALANNPNDLDVAYFALKAAEAKEDADLAKTWAARTSAIARKEIESNKAPADDEAKQHLEYVKGVDTYSEYVLYELAAKLKDPKQVAELGAALEAQNVKSQYMPLLSGVYLNALVQSGQAAKSCPAAEKLAGANAKDVDALIFAADCSLRQNRYDRAISHAGRAIEALASKPKPEGMSEPEWASKKATLLGRSNWIVGISYASQNKYGPADKALRAALPSVKGEPQLAALALFHLGLANYNLGKALGDRARVREGLRFFEQCAAITSPVQDQAARNARTIRGEIGAR